MLTLGSVRIILIHRVCPSVILIEPISVFYRLCEIIEEKLEIF